MSVFLAAATASVLPTLRVERARPAWKPETRVVRVLPTRPTHNRLPDVLRSVSFHGKSYGPSGSLTTPSLRGSSAEGVLVELDGIRLNSPLNGMADLGKIPLLGLDQLEIENGASSGGAVGGAIRLRTHDRLSPLLALGIGSFGQTSLKAQLGEEHLSFALARDSAKNDYPFLDRGQRAIRQNSGITTTSLFAKGHRPVGDWTVSPMVLVDLRDQAVPGAINFPTPKARQEDLSMLGALSVEGHPEEDTNARFSLTQRLDRHHFEDPDAVLTPKTTALGIDATEAKLELRRPSGDHLPSLALGARQEQSAGTIRQRQDCLLVRMADEWSTDWGTLEGGLAWERFSTFGSAWSPKLGFSRTDGGIRTHASLGSSFRAPTFNELYWPADAFAKGNPAIRPEKVQSLDLGWDGKWGAFQTGLTLFGSLGQDQISWQPGEGGKWTPLNLARTSGLGAEWEGAFRWEDKTLAGHYTHCRMTSDGKQLVGRPLEQIALAGGWTGGESTLGGDLASVSERFTTAANTESLPAYWLLGLSAEWKWGEKTVGLRVSNLLDTPYSIVPYYPMPGRTIALNLVQPL